LSYIFGANAKDGLSTFLSSDVELMDLVKITEFPNLYLISSGPVPPNPADLLSSQKMDNLVAFLTKNFDYVLFDTPPILVVSDMIAMGPMVDTTILVTRANHTPLHALKQAKQKLAYHKLKCLGIVFNDVSVKSQDGYYTHQYYHHYKT
jgi:capsular exopolysaccharide synthesis family protein